jgi:hypothetical protein
LAQVIGVQIPGGEQMKAKTKQKKKKVKLKLNFVRLTKKQVEANRSTAYEYVL